MFTRLASPDSASTSTVEVTTPLANGASGAQDVEKDIQVLRQRAEGAAAELDRLRQDNERLQELVRHGGELQPQHVCLHAPQAYMVRTSIFCCMQVNSKHNQGVSICGYLAKYRPFAHGLMSQTWEVRLVVGRASV